MLSFLIVSLFCVALADLGDTNPPYGSCLCMTTSGVNVRDNPGLSSSVIGTANQPDCFTYLGLRLTTDGYRWFKVDFRGREGWIAGNFMRVGSASQCSVGGGNCNDVEIVSRSRWGARPPRSTSSMSTPVSYAFIHHTVTPACTSLSSCIGAARQVQNIHMNGNGWSDIGYSFLVGEDGRAYEGRGWRRVGGHTFGYNDRSVAISVIGDFTSRNPNPAAQRAVRNLLACGVSQGYLRSNYELFGHRNANCTECPGNTYYRALSSYPNWSNRSIPRYCKKSDAP